MKTSSVENQLSSAGFFNGPRRGGGDDEGGNGDYNEYFFLALTTIAAVNVDLAARREYFEGLLASGEFWGLSTEEKEKVS